MDIKNTAIGAKVVIESLICLLENEGVDISSIKFKVGSDSEGYESPKIEFQKLINITLNELDELKTQVPEGFVLVNAEQLNQWGHMANAAEQYGCCDCFESRGYAHNLACEINSYFEPVEAQEQVG